MPSSAACPIRTLEPVNLDVMLARFAEHWSPTKIARVNDDVRIVKIHGEFTWHRHADTDEFFLVPGGRLTIQLPDRHVVPGAAGPVRRTAASSTARGPMPKPVPLSEPGTVVNTGDTGAELTAEVEELA